MPNLSDTSKRPQHEKTPSASMPDDHQRELEIARRVQSALVPVGLPSAQEIDMASLYLPCSTVGGDLFDVIPISDNVLAFLIFDVSGHGVSSALIASMAKASFINHIRSLVSPRSVMERVNTELQEHLTGDYFVTAFVGYLDLHNNKLAYCNAGHTYPLIFRKEDNSFLPLRTSGLFVGMFEDGHYEEKNSYLNPGDWLVLFTNGLYELFDPENELAARKAFEQSAHAIIGASSPASFVQWLESLHRQRKDGRMISDDIGVIAAEMLTQSRRDRIKEQLGFSMSDPVYLQFISYFEEMDRAAGIILREMDEFGYPDESIRKMKIALTELLANAIYHGNKKDHSRKVTIGHLVDKNAVKVSIMDEGTGFDIAGVPNPTLPENLEKDCGRGLFIVRSYIDKLEFNDRGNRVTIWKYHTLGA
jgi:anti-sigma regulatory factor (Ser/Thr protein kinase)